MLANSSACSGMFFDPAHDRRVQAFLEQSSRLVSSIEFIDEGVVAPLTRFVRGGQSGVAEFDGGVYYSDGSICSRGNHIKNGAINKPISFDSSRLAQVQKGSHVFCGLLKNEHWGHFFAESLARLWAVNFLPDDFRSLIFYVRDRSLGVPRFVGEALELIAPGKDIVLVDVPTRFEILAVPDQLVHPTIGFVAGHERVRNGFRHLRGVQPGSDKYVYVSRSRLNNNEGEIVGEIFIERELKKQGYKIIHPQEMTLRDQIAAYMGAHKIIFAEGSPFHLFSLVCSSAQDVFIIRRRRLGAVFDWQVASFGGGLIKGLPCIKEFHVPVVDSGSLLRAKTVLDFNLLRDQLAFFGFIDASLWVSPGRDEVDFRLAQSFEKMAIDFVRVDF